MIQKTPQGFQVQSAKGKPLSKPSLSRKQAENRLAEVEMFKHVKRGGERPMMPDPRRQNMEKRRKLEQKLERKKR